MNDLLFLAVKAAVYAGKEIVNVKSGEIIVNYKEDNSPLTNADIASNAIIINILKQSGIPILSEESKIVQFNERKSWKQLWIIDPLDGTKEFAANRKEYTTNVALYVDGNIKIGAVYAPELDSLYFASEKIGSYLCNLKSINVLESFEVLLENSSKLPIQNKRDQVIVVASRSHLSDDTKDIITRIKSTSNNVKLKSYGSSLKLCKIAEGEAHIYPRLGPTMEWDIAASIPVLKNAGINIQTFPDLKELSFNKENLLNPHFIVYTSEFNSLIKKLV